MFYFLNVYFFQQIYIFLLEIPTVVLFKHSAEQVYLL